MAFGNDPVMERFRSDFFEERDGQMFLKGPQVEGDPMPAMPVSYELYLELTNAHETNWLIGKAMLIIFVMCGLLFGAYRWLASDQYIQVFGFAGLGFLAGLGGSFLLAMRVPDRIGRLHGAWLKAQKLPRSARASTDDLF